MCHLQIWPAELLLFVRAVAVKNAVRTPGAAGVHRPLCARICTAQSPPPILQAPHALRGMALAATRLENALVNYIKRL